MVTSEMAQNFSRFLYLNTLLNRTPAAPQLLSKAILSTYLLRAWSWVEGAEVATQLQLCCGQSVAEETQPWHHLQTSWARMNRLSLPAGPSSDVTQVTSWPFPSIAHQSDRCEAAGAVLTKGLGQASNQQMR